MLEILIFSFSCFNRICNPSFTSCLCRGSVFMLPVWAEGLLSGPSGGTESFSNLLICSAHCDTNTSSRFSGVRTKTNTHIGKEKHLVNHYQTINKRVTSRNYIHQHCSRNELWHFDWTIMVFCFIMFSIIKATFNISLDHKKRQSKQEDTKHPQRCKAASRSKITMKRLKNLNRNPKQLD